MAHLITSLNIGGTERYLLELCRAQKAKYNCRVGFMKAEGPVADELRSEAVPVEYVGTAAGIYRFLRKHKPRVLHTHLYRANIVGRFVGAAARVPIIISSQHSIGAWRSPRHSLLDRWSSSFADCIVTDSEAARRVLIDRERIDSNRIRVIHSSAVKPDAMLSALSRDSARAKLGLGVADPVFGCVARLHPAKGVQHLPALARTLARAMPAAKIVVAGDGPLRSDLERRIRGGSLDSMIHLLGWRIDIPDILAALDVFFLPSVEESFPRTILEALAAGCPVVATDVGGVPGIITDGEHGLLVPSGNTEALAESMLRLYNNRDEAQRLAKAGQARVRRHFTLEHMLTEMEALYDELNGERAKP